MFDVSPVQSDRLILLMTERLEKLNSKTTLQAKKHAWCEIEDTLNSHHPGIKSYVFKKQWSNLIQMAK